MSGNDRAHRGVVYAIRQISTGFVFIGSTEYEQHRRRFHANTLRYGTHSAARLQEACDRTSIADFEFGVIQRVGFRGSLQRQELIWIDRIPCYFNTRSSRWITTDSKAFRNADKLLPALVWQPLYEPKAFYIVSPDRRDFYAGNLSEFCRAMGLCITSMSGLASGKLKSYQGWACFRVKDGKPYANLPGGWIEATP